LVRRKREKSVIAGRISKLLSRVERAARGEETEREGRKGTTHSVGGRSLGRSGRDGGESGVLLEMDLNPLEHS